MKKKIKNETIVYYLNNTIKLFLNEKKLYYERSFIFIHEIG